MSKYIGPFIAVDFDGTVVRHEYPRVGRDVPGAVETLKLMVERGAKLILNTMRSGKELDDAVKWFESKGIPLFGVNHNPTQDSWTSSPKVYAQHYIDDAAVGSFLYTEWMGEELVRPFVNWGLVRIWFDREYPRAS